MYNLWTNFLSFDIKKSFWKHRRKGVCRSAPLPLGHLIPTIKEELQNQGEPLYFTLQWRTSPPKVPNYCKMKTCQELWKSKICCICFCCHQNKYRFLFITRRWLGIIFILCTSMQANIFGKWQKFIFAGKTRVLL